MGLFSASQIEQINQVAAKSKELIEPPKVVASKGINDELQATSQKVIEYFKDSPAILITTPEELHDYVDKCIEAGYAGLDTETTGLDRIKDTIVGASLYYPGGVECYIPIKHLVPIFDTPYKNQLTYEQVGAEIQRLVDGKVKLIFANYDFDSAMIYKDFKVDLNPAFYYDVILAWRCLKENEPDNALKVLYNKYVLKGHGDPMKFNDFFSVKLFPYCKPDVAKLYAANDAKITYELFRWQLPYVTKTHEKCKKAHLEGIADLVWNVEFPLAPICQNMHRLGIYLDKDTASMLVPRYKEEEAKEKAKLAEMVDQQLADHPYHRTFGSSAPPFTSGANFNPKSPPHVKHLLYTIMGLPAGKGQSTDKEVLKEMNLPITNQILKVRSFGVLISTFVEKMPKATTDDSRIHARLNQIGAGTGRLSSSEPNIMNIPSHATDIRHMFRATPGYVMLSSDYSRQEPAITAYVSQDKAMLDSFIQDRDIYATIASLAFNVPYENCLEFHPETHEYQPDGKARRGEAKTILLGVTYGRAIPSIAEQLYATRDDMSDEAKIKGAQRVYDAVMKAFPGLQRLMISSQNSVRKVGYTETILGRRRHLPDMQLPKFQFTAMKGYVNPDIDPLDPTTLAHKSDIPDRIVKQLEQEFNGYKYFGQIARRTRELYDEGIKVTNNSSKINDATRQVLNSIIQGSAADMTKLAILMLESNEEWKSIGGRLLVPVHDELIAEVPIEHWERGGELLSAMMRKAAEFLPFSMKCDVTTTLRWYGLEYPCKYPKPASIETEDPEEIKWIQYHLFESEYVLPIYKEADGSKPRGDAAMGVNGIKSEEYTSAIAHYLGRYQVSQSDFLDDIERRVTYGNVESLK